MSDKNFKVKNGLDANGAVTITQPDTSTTPLTIFANTLATGSDLFQVKRPDGTVRFAVGNDGALTVKSNINFTGGNMTMYPANSAQTALIVMGQTNQSVANLIVRAGTGQSGNLQEWRDQNNNVAVSVGPDFALRGIAGGFFGTANGNIVGVNYLGVKGWAANHIPFVVQGVASQTGDLTRWVDSSANTLAKVDASGSITAVDLTLSGNLTVNGTTTNINSTNLVIEDKNIVLADVATPTDTTADGAGITIKGATDKTLSWVQSTKSFTTSEPVIINNSSTDVPTLIVKLNTGQTSNIQEWRDHVGNVVAKIGPLYGSNIFQFDPFSYGAGSGYSSIGIGGRFISNEQRAAQSKFGVTTGEWVLGALRATDSQVGAFASSTTLPTFVIKGVTSQSANLQEWQNVSGTILASVTESGGIGIGTSTLGTNSKLTVSNGAIKISSGGTANADASLHISSSYGGFDRLTQMHPSVNNKPALNLMGYMGTGSVGGWFAWGVDSDGNWKINNGTSFSNPDFAVLSNATVGINTTTSLGQLGILNGSASRVGLVIRGSASQTADLQQWQNSSGTVLASINSNGGLFIKPASTSGNLLKFENTGNTYGWSVPASYANSIVFDVNHDPRIYWGSNVIWTMESTPNSSVFRPYTADRYAMSVRGLSGQTADLQQWQNSSGTTLAKVDNTGNVTAPSYNLSNSLYSLRKTIKKTVGDGTAVPINTTYDLFQFSFSQSLQGTFYFQVSMRGSGYGQNLTYSLPATYAMDWLANGYSGNLFTNNTTWVSLTPQTFSGRHLMVGDDLKLQARVDANNIYFRLKANAALSNGGASPYFDVYIQHSEEFANCTIAELSSTGTDTNSQTTLANFLSSKGGTTELFNPVTIFSNSALNTPIKIKGFFSQTADLQQWQSSAGTTYLNITNAGAMISNGGVTIASNPTINAYGAAMKIASGVNTYPMLILQAASSQTADIQQWKNSGSTTIASIDAYGNAGFGGAGANSNQGLYVKTNSNPAVVGIIVQGATSQTADLQQWKNAVGTVLALVDAYGRLGINTTSLANSTGGYSMVSIYNNNTVNTNLVIKSYPSQTATLTEWQNSSGTTLAKIDVLGNFTATSKSFDIEHPTKENMRLRYASLEGPENGVYIRGTATTNIIELPDYWTGLVHEDSITVSLTSVGSAQNIYVEKIENNKVYIGGDLEKAFFTVYGERKDIDNLTVEY